jgi:hypothetical protein
VTAGELALLLAVVLCALAFAALVVTLVRVRDTLVQLRSDIADVRAATARAEATTTDALAQARADLDRFDQLLGSAEAISGTLGRTSRTARVALSTPMIKAASIATGTTRAVRKLGER